MRVFNMSHAVVWIGKGCKSRPVCFAVCSMLASILDLFTIIATKPPITFLISFSWICRMTVWLILSCINMGKRREQLRASVTVFNSTWRLLVADITQLLVTTVGNVTHITCATALTLVTLNAVSLKSYFGYALVFCHYFFNLHESNFILNLDVCQLFLVCYLIISLIFITAFYILINDNTTCRLWKSYETVTSLRSLYSLPPPWWVQSVR